MTACNPTNFPYRQHGQVFENADSYSPWLWKGSYQGTSLDPAHLFSPLSMTAYTKIIQDHSNEK